MVNENCSLPILFADFEIENPTIAFPPAGTNQTQCTAITIVSDATLEKEETFCLNLSSSDPDVTFEPSSVTTCLMIADEDSE